VRQTYHSVFLHKRTEDRVAQQGLVTWELKEALLVTTQKLPREVNSIKELMINLKKHSGAIYKISRAILLN
jgi:hypothetical protein